MTDQMAIGATPAVGSSSTGSTNAADTLAYYASNNTKKKGTAGVLANKPLPLLQNGYAASPGPQRAFC